MLDWRNDVLVAEIEADNPVSSREGKYRFPSATIISLKRWSDYFEKVLTSHEYSCWFACHCKPTQEQKDKLSKV